MGSRLGSSLLSTHERTFLPSGQSLRHVEIAMHIETSNRKGRVPPTGEDTVGGYHTHGDYSRIDRHGNLVRKR